MAGSIFFNGNNNDKQHAHVLLFVIIGFDKKTVYRNNFFWNQTKKINSPKQ